jgi:hypothetical protein
MNNVFPEFPAIMQDGRAFSNWHTCATINENLRKRAQVYTNSDYRSYLQTHAMSIMEYDRNEACLQTGCPTTYFIKPEHKPSDLEELYLSRQQLQKKMYIRVP